MIGIGRGWTGQTALRVSGSGRLRASRELARAFLLWLEFRRLEFALRFMIDGFSAAAIFRPRSRERFIGSRQRAWLGLRSMSLIWRWAHQT